MSQRRFLSMVVALAAMAPSVAGAFERQQHLGVHGGLALLSVGGKDSLDVGAGGGIHYAYGLSDAFNLMIEGSYAQVALQEATAPKIPPNRPTGITNFGVGASYVLDVTRWVPYGGLLADGFVLTGGNLVKPVVAFGLGLALGLDYQATRNVAFGFAFRQHFAFSAFSDYPSYSQFFLRAEYVWGW